MQAALDKVSSLRASGEGWGKIAKDLGVKLGPVVSAAHRAERSFRNEERMERGERPERTERPERSERPEHFERPGQPAPGMEHPGH